MLAYLFRSHAVQGHDDKPENKASQPLGGHGPKAMMSPKPPMPATIVHAQAAIQPRPRSSCRAQSGQVVEAITNDKMTSGAFWIQVINPTPVESSGQRPIRSTRTEMLASGA